MGLKGFIQKDYYSKISRVIVDIDMGEISFELKTFNRKGGDEVINPMEFKIIRAVEVKKYLDTLPTNTLTPPAYPELCTAREASVPMWPDGTPQPEINDYNNALIAYDEALDTYNAAIVTADAAKAAKAETDNGYEKFFSHRKVFTTSNILACAYTYLKTRDSFVGVNDAED